MAFLNESGNFLDETPSSGVTPGTPVNAVQASKLIDPAGDGNDILWTSRVAGRPGNRISVEYRHDIAAEKSLTTQGIEIETESSTDPESLAIVNGTEEDGALQASYAARKLTITLGMDMGDPAHAFIGDAGIVDLEAPGRPGAAGNSLRVSVLPNVGEDAPLAVDFDDPLLTIHLGTDHGDKAHVDLGDMAVRMEAGSPGSDGNNYAAEIKEGVYDGELSVELLPALTVLDGLVAWLDASKEAYGDGDPVTTWHDQSGHGYDATRVGSATAPAFKIAGGFRSLVFDGHVAANGTRLNLAAAAEQIGGDLSWFAVLKTNAGSGGRTWRIDLNGPGMTHWWEASGTPRWTQINDAGNARNANAGDALGAGVFHVVTALRGGGPDDIRLRTDTVLKDAEPNQFPPEDHAITPTIGGLSDGQNTYDGEIAEMIFYNRRLTDAEVAAVEAYLTVKYASPVRTVAITLGMDNFVLDPAKNTATRIANAINDAGNPSITATVLDVYGILDADDVTIYPLPFTGGGENPQLDPLKNTADLVTDAVDALFPYAPFDANDATPGVISVTVDNQPFTGGGLFFAPQPSKNLQSLVVAAINELNAEGLVAVIVAEQEEPVAETPYDIPFLVNADEFALDASLSIATSGNRVVVHLATDVYGEITTLRSELLAAAIYAPTVSAEAVGPYDHLVTAMPETLLAGGTPSGPISPKGTVLIDAYNMYVALEDAFDRKDLNFTSHWQEIPL